MSSFDLIVQLWYSQTLLLLCLFVFFGVTIHHFVVCGRFFDLADMLHHEFFSFVCLAFGLGSTLKGRCD